MYEVITLRSNKMSLIFYIYFFTIFSSMTKAWQENPPKLPGYNFQYFVRNDETGDFKSQQEVREGDSVRGSYSVAEPNGDLRVVTYHADQNSGFNAKVQVQPRGIPIPFPTIKSFHPMSPPSSNYQPVDIKVLPPSTTTEPTKKIVGIYINDKTKPVISTSDRASVASITQEPPVKHNCPFVEHFDNRYRAPAAPPHQKVIPTLSNVPMTPLFFQPTDHMKQISQSVSTQHKNIGPAKGPTLSPMWAFILVPAHG